MSVAGTLCTFGAFFAAGMAAHYALVRLGDHKRRPRRSYRADVEAFHYASGQPAHDIPGQPHADTLKLRARLIAEETKETLTALGCVSVTVDYGEPSAGGFNLVEVADGCADLKYVLFGTELACGIPSDAVWDAVHETNMAKFDDGLRLDDNGKVMKPEGWKPPNIAAIIEDHSERV